MDPGRARVAALTLAVDVDTASVVQALRREGVEPVLLKGPVVGRFLQLGGELRPYSDIDLMVGPDDLGRAEATLRHLGYEPDLARIPPDPFQHSTAWRHSCRTSVDLHHTLHFVVAPHEQTWEVVRRDAATMDVAGTPVLIPGSGVLALHLALHAAAGGHKVPKPLNDLERGLAKLPRPVWDSAMALAAALHVVEAFGGGLGLCPAGVHLAEELGVPTAGTMRMHLEWATTRHAGPATIELIVAQPSLRAKVAAITSKCFPPAAHVRPVGGRPGGAWLALGYGMRLGRMALQTPASVVAWTRLSRAGRRAGRQSPP